jgi:ABC-type nitrate/sulfonate/bicarbonate transport system permease component
MGILLAIWTLLCVTFARDLPNPIVTFKALGIMLRARFRGIGRHDGRGNLVFASLGRVFMGFGVAS